MAILRLHYNYIVVNYGYTMLILSLPIVTLWLTMVLLCAYYHYLWLHYGSLWLYYGYTMVILWLPMVTVWLTMVILWL